MTFIPAQAPARQLSWLNVTSHLDPRYGGIAKVLPEYCAAVSSGSGCTASLLGFCDDAERSAQQMAVTTETVRPGKLAWLGGERPRSLSRRVSHFDGVHIHGLWEEHTFAAVRAARAAGKPYIISAHGMLEPWALRNKRWKKTMYSWLTERDNLRGASCLHALTAAEAADYRRYGVRSPIAIIPNGVRIEQAADSQLFFDAFPALRNRRVVLFLGRIHPKKGLDMLVRAWKTVLSGARVNSSVSSSPNLSTAPHLVIARPDTEETQRALERQIRSLGIGDSVTFTGMLRGELKWSALHACQLFVLPSHSEGLSVSVLEALAMSKPVLVTESCNIPEVGGYGCGWVTASEAAPLAAALREFLGLRAEAAGEMGRRAQNLVKERFNWDRIGAQTREVYRWIAGGPKPVGVRMVWE